MTEIEKLNSEILSLHRKLAASELEVGNYKQRYEASNIKYLAKEKELMDLKYQAVPVNKLTAHELTYKMYQRWILGNGDEIYLIPPIELDNIHPDMVVTCIDGSKVLANKMDLDIRGGVLAYGVYAAK